jgi:hypothetical protein
VASTPDLTRRTEITLKYTSAMLEDLIEDAHCWNSRPEDQRADFALDWEEMMQRVGDLASGRYADEVTPGQEAQLRVLAERLVNARKVVASLGLDYPELGHLLADVLMDPDERVAHEINALRHWAGRLRTMGDFWDSPLLDVRERRAFPAEWDAVVGRFANVEALARRGEIKTESRESLRQVADWLAELLPTMRRLGLRQPDPEALERARRVEAA